MNMFYDPETGGFYDKTVHGNNIPKTAINLSKSSYSSLIDGLSQGKIIITNPDGTVQLQEKEIIFDFSQALKSKNFEIIEKFKAAMAPVTSLYTDEDIASFPTQEAEAKAWQADSNSPTPFIDGLLANRPSVDKATLVQRIIDNANAYKSVAGPAIGKKQHYEDLLYALKAQHEDSEQPDVTKADIDAIVVDYS